MEAAERLSHQGIEATVLRLTELSDPDIHAVSRLMVPNAPVVILEEACAGSGIWETLSAKLHTVCPGCKIVGKDLGDQFVPHGAIDILYKT